MRRIPGWFLFAVIAATVFLSAQLLLKCLYRSFVDDAALVSALACVTCLPFCLYVFAFRLNKPSLPLLIPSFIIITLAAVAALCGKATLVCCAICLAGPVNEEIVYRGCVFGNCRKSMGFAPAALLSALLFAAGHQNIPQGLAAFAMGMLFALLFEKTNRLSVPIALHIAWNALSLILF